MVFGPREGAFLYSFEQSIITLPPFRQGCHLVTDVVLQGVPRLSSCRIGLLHLFLQHTSAALIINENADPDVRSDLQMSIERIAPETFPYRHSDEGPDDMAAHLRTALTGTELTIPVRDGTLALGRWQGIYLWEHRALLHSRRMVATLHGLIS